MEKIRILLVDDDRQNSEFLRKFLEVEGYEVSYAENGGKGWETFSAIRPDLVLLDVNMRFSQEFREFQTFQSINRRSKLLNSSFCRLEHALEPYKY